MIVQNLIDSPQWAEVNNGTALPATGAVYPLFNQAGGPNAKTSMEVENQFSATSDYRAFKFAFQILTDGLDDNTAADIKDFIAGAYFRLQLNRQNVFNIAASAFENIPMIGLAAGATGVAGSLNFCHTFGKEAPLNFPGGQSFQFELIAPDLTTGDLFSAKVSMQGYELLRNRAEQAV